jgi:DNA-binding protein
LEDQKLGVEMSSMPEENVVYIGRKPVMSYVMAVMTALRPEVNEIALLARGSAICTAVDTAEIIRRKFMRDVKVKEIKIGTEEVKDESGRVRSVSTIEIALTRESP